MRADGCRATSVCASLVVRYRHARVFAPDRGIRFASRRRRGRTARAWFSPTLRAHRAERERAVPALRGADAQADRAADTARGPSGIPPQPASPAPHGIRRATHRGPVARPRTRSASISRRESSSAMGGYFSSHRAIPIMPSRSGISPAAGSARANFSPRRCDASFAKRSASRSRSGRSDTRANRTIRSQTFTS